MSDSIDKLSIKMEVDMSSFDVGVKSMEQTMKKIDEHAENARNILDEIASSLKEAEAKANSIYTTFPPTSLPISTFPYSDMKKTDIQTPNNANETSSVLDEDEINRAIENAINRQAVLMSR